MGQFYNNAAGILARKLIDGNIVTHEETTVLVAGAQLLVGADPERTRIYVENLGAGVIYLAFSGDVGATKGVRLPANGGYMEMNLLDDLDAVTNAIFLYSAAGGQNIYYFTQRREYAQQGG